MLEVTIIGHIGADAEVKESNGNRFLKFSVADTTKYTDTQGVVTERVTWVDVIKKIGAESRLAEYLKKGTQVFVRGKLSTNVYQTRSGEFKAGINCSAREVTMLSASNSDNQQNPAQYPQPHYQPTQGQYQQPTNYPTSQRNQAPQGYPSHQQGSYYKQ